jgi:predicted RNase H-like HicB family nuclease
MDGKMKTAEYGFRVLWSEEDEGFVAICPEFPNVSALGHTPEEAVQEIRKALDLAIASYRDSNWPLPVPEILSDYSGKLLIRVPNSMHARLVQRAEDEGVSMNTMANTFLAEGLSKRDTMENDRKQMLSVLAQAMQNRYLGAGSMTTLNTAPGLARSSTLVPNLEKRGTHV